MTSTRLPGALTQPIHKVFYYILKFRLRYNGVQVYCLGDSLEWVGGVLGVPPSP